MPETKGNHGLGTSGTVGEQKCAEHRGIEGTRSLGGVQTQGAGRAQKSEKAVVSMEDGITTYWRPHLIFRYSKRY